MRRLIAIFSALGGLSIATIDSPARVVEYDLTIREESRAPAGRSTRALTVNGSVPGPVLRFREGDTAVIRVHNRMPREETSVHWHGLLVPVDQDGVPHVTTPAIRPGETFTYQFPIRQSGTYWYHSHSGLQEQEGIYGAIVIEPRHGERVKADRDEVVVLSDWTRESGAEVMRTLMRPGGSDWYAFRKGSPQSIAGAIEAGAWREWWAREWSRMPPMDIADVAYDAFLVNGRPAVELPGRSGERVRLRLINAAASTYFYLDSAAGPLRVVAADGQPVEPVDVPRLFIGMGETYDVVVTVPSAGAWEVRATAQDGSGSASAWLGTGDRHPAQGPPPPDLYRMDEMTAIALDDLEPGTAVTRLPRPGSPWRSLRSVEPSRVPDSAPRRTLRMHLTGDMERYLWSINGKTAAEDAIVPVRYGEILRIELVNDTMMHHPMHLHGHFFRVIGPQGRRAPLKHTIDLPPMGRRTIEFEANETGDWLFHCHLLYHMHAGMTRVFSYDNQGHGHHADAGHHSMDSYYSYSAGRVFFSGSEGDVVLRNMRNDFVFSWDLAYGDGLDESHAADKIKYELDLLWKRYFDPNFSTFLGGRLTNEPGANDRFVGGVEYRLPLLVHGSLGLDSEGDVRIGLEKEFPVTGRLSIAGSVRYDTGSEWEWSAGAEFLIAKPLSLAAGYHSDRGVGAGIAFRF